MYPELKACMAFYYKFILSYNGSGYCGWQQQKDNPNSVEEILKNSICRIHGNREFSMMASSRTDAGVHATGQTIKLIVEQEIDPERFFNKVNSTLPNSIQVEHFEVSSKQFNPNRDVLSKTYFYYFTPEKKVLPQFKKIVFEIGETLDFKVMNKACSALIGEHDFIQFGILRKGASNSRRDIFNASITKTQFGELQENVFIFKIEGRGFLKYMVRTIAYALFEVGKGRLSLEDFQACLTNPSKDPIKRFKKAPAHGLNLVSVVY
jgi:tRNA pseudouridine38-40 synthase